LSKTFKVIANPNAAGGRGARVLPDLERRLRKAGLEFEIERTSGSGHATALARRALESGTSRILVVGGDGTIHEVANGLLDDSEADGRVDLPAMAILPVGTGNDFHRMVRAPAGIESAIQTLGSGIERHFEVGRAKWEGGGGRFVNLLGVGIDVEVLRWRPRFGRLPGLLQYMGALAGALWTHRPVPFELTFVGEDDEAETLAAPVLLAALTVGPSIGGGFLLSPKARPDDGLLDLFVVERLGPLKVARYLPSVLRGRLDGKPDVHRRQIRRLRIRALDDRPFRFELDGELMATETRFLDIQVEPRRLRVLELFDQDEDGRTR
jgi:diacylglycerol kinase (ATP)